MQVRIVYVWYILDMHNLCIHTHEYTYQIYTIHMYTLTITHIPSYNTPTSTNPHGAVIDTSPTSIPFNVGAMSPGRPQNSSNTNTVKQLVPAATVVLTAARDTVAAHPTIHPLYPVLNLWVGVGSSFFFLSVLMCVLGVYVGVYVDGVCVCVFVRVCL